MSVRVLDPLALPLNNDRDLLVLADLVPPGGREDRLTDRLLLLDRGGELGDRARDLDGDSDRLTYGHT